MPKVTPSMLLSLFFILYFRYIINKLLLELLYVVYTGNCFQEHFHRRFNQNSSFAGSWCAKQYEFPCLLNYQIPCFHPIDVYWRRFAFLANLFSLWQLKRSNSFYSLSIINLFSSNGHGSCFHSYFLLTSYFFIICSFLLVSLYVCALFVYLYWWPT